jgi:NAD(P)-dependent dehydrogenase (short-subunit alcohol dehydrogenase family)
MNFKGEVAIVTGAGSGLGRSHALALADRGAKVVVNDVSTSASGEGRRADEVVEQIREAGGEAMADKSDVTDAKAINSMVESTISKWGRIDILINNAGILRDKSFANMEAEHFHKVVDVHLNGAMYCTKAVWGHMKDQQYGRILMTTSASGIYGNFGQANYGAAKSGVVGLMNVLAIEGQRYGIKVNSLAPTAATDMTDGLMDEAAWKAMTPESITPGALFLVSKSAPTKTILGAGGGVFSVAQMVESAGVYLDEADRTPESIAARWDAISDLSARVSTGSAFDQTQRYLDIVEKQDHLSSSPETSDLSISAKVQP